MSFREQQANQTGVGLGLALYIGTETINAVYDGLYASSVSARSWFAILWKRVDAYLDQDQVKMQNAAHLHPPHKRMCACSVVQ